jgi:hypothetical protein
MYLYLSGIYDFQSNIVFKVNTVAFSGVGGGEVLNESRTYCRGVLMTLMFQLLAAVTVVR